VAVTITEQKYGPTTGALTGWLGLVLCVGGIVPLLTDPTAGRIRLAFAIALAGVVVWSFMLRPRIIIREQEPSTLLLRNPFSTWQVPLAAINRVQIKAITRVEVEGAGYDGVAVGRRVKAMVRGPVVKHGDGLLTPGLRLGTPPRREPKHPSATSPEAIADLLTEQILAASDRAKESGQPTEPVLRHWAWVELVLLAAGAVGLAVTYLV